MKKLVPVLFIFLLNKILAQDIHVQATRPSNAHAVMIKEYKKTFTTYPFGDPNPIPLLSPVYPYHRFDGFTTTPVQKEWKVVELENDYIRLLILPEIGGKIWTAIEKSTGKSFLYDNHVIKFRDIAMRGPWTSGGLESNFGIIGHTPNCSTPVDYTTRKDEDGGVTCIIGALDLLTRSNWRMEIHLPRDKAFFTTRAYWFNQTAVSQPYYHWMNAGLKAGGNLEFIYPGTKYIGHEGEYADWPINRQNGKNLACYEQNNFGGPKSYHVFGTYTDFSGAYWHDDRMGMIRYGAHDDKAGKKIWIWGLSRQGMIWEKMLTDHDGQYVEVQSGRLFNQNADKSSITPFKHRSLLPYESDTWIEYWYPVLATKGIVKANAYGALNLVRENSWLKVYFSPVQSLRDTLEITAGDQIIYRKPVSLSPMQLFVDSLKSDEKEEITLTLGNTKFRYTARPHTDDLSRPVDAPGDFDWNSAYGLFVSGKEAMDQKNYPGAEEKLRASLALNPAYLPALVKMAELLYRNMRYNEALEMARKALSIDTEDGAANYYYGLINEQLGKETDARDGFDIATLDPAFRSAAYTELSKIYLREQHYDRAMDYAQKALDYNRLAIEALQLQAVACRRLKEETRALEALKKIESMDALNHFCRFERYCWHPGEENKSQFTSLIRNELPQETYLELGIWYHRIGCDREAIDLFGLCPASTEALYWLAFLQDKPLDLSRLNPLLSFPFRSETGMVLEQLLRQQDHWLLKYHLALIYHDRNRTEECRQLLQSCGNTPDFAPFYAVRAAINKDYAGNRNQAGNTNEAGNKSKAGSKSKAMNESETDLKKALSLDDQWRYRKLLATWYVDHGQYAAALSVVGPWYQAHPEQYIMGMLCAKMLLLNRRYAEADKLLSKLTIIPFEGATEGHELYREAKLMQALDHIGMKKFSSALAFVRQAGEWPENLGVGKPYEEDIDQRMEEWIARYCLIKTGESGKADAALEKITAFQPAVRNTVANFSPSNTLVTAWALEKAFGHARALQWLDEQVARYPGNKLLMWSRAKFLGQPYELTVTDKEANTRILERWIEAAY